MVRACQESFSSGGVRLRSMTAQAEWAWAATGQPGIMKVGVVMIESAFTDIQLHGMK